MSAIDKDNTVDILNEDEIQRLFDDDYETDSSSNPISDDSFSDDIEFGGTNDGFDEPAIICDEKDIRQLTKNSLELKYTGSDVTIKVVGFSGTNEQYTEMLKTIMASAIHISDKVEIQETHKEV